MLNTSNRTHRHQLPHAGERHANGHASLVQHWGGCGKRWPPLWMACVAAACMLQGPQAQRGALSGRRRPYFYLRRRLFQEAHRQTTRRSGNTPVEGLGHTPSRIAMHSMYIYICACVGVRHATCSGTLALPGWWPVMVGPHGLQGVLHCLVLQLPSMDMPLTRRIHACTCLCCLMPLSEGAACGSGYHATQRDRPRRGPRPQPRPPPPAWRRDSALRSQQPN